MRSGSAVKNRSRIEKSRRLFDWLSPIYYHAFKRQRKRYAQVYGKMNNCNLNKFSSILDIGCGTGAMASVFADMGLKTYALDHSLGMVRVAKKRLANTPVNLLQGGAAGSLPFPADSFDIVIAAFVAHGLRPGPRQKLYEEMKRVSRHLVILHDYSQARSLLTNLTEYAEGGDYFEFIKVVNDELIDYFGNLEVVKIARGSCCYICNID